MQGRMILPMGFMRGKSSRFGTLGTVVLICDWLPALTLTLSPGEREQHSNVSRKLECLSLLIRLFGLRMKVHGEYHTHEFTRDGGVVLPLLGERAGVREDLPHSLHRSFLERDCVRSTSRSTPL